MPSANGHGPKRAILYARVSGEEQAKKGYSLSDQRQALREWAEDEGYEVLEEIADEGWSGAYLERPGLDRVRDLVEAGGVGVVAALFRDRIARGVYVQILKEEFAQHGTRLIALNARIDDSPEGELHGGITGPVRCLREGQDLREDQAGQDEEGARARSSRLGSRLTASVTTRPAMVWWCTSPRCL
jgi:site-specific DNA recombinase